MESRAAPRCAGSFIQIGRRFVDMCGASRRQDRKDALDGSAFDRFVLHIAENASRRVLLRSAFAATVVGLGVTSLLGPDDAAAKSCKAKCNKKKNKNKRAQCKKNCDDNNQRCRTENASCSTDGECCATQNLVCDVPFGAGNSDKKCCRGQGATCESIPGGAQCCTGEAGVRAFQCVSGVCQACPGGNCP